jgi:ubiquinol-cytochrome c reductase cytochrome c subunit
MRRRVALTLLLGALGLAGAAAAELPSGITRPADEAGLSKRELGEQLYAANCATCHGIAGEGIPQPRSEQGAGHVTGQGPSLKDAGALAADFYLRTGLMPLGNPRSQPWRSRVELDKRELAALVDYVASLGNGPPIPAPHPEDGNLAEGLHLFTEHCAGCHQVVAEGGYVTDARVPLIKNSSPVQIAEAVRVGPYLMPKFSRKAISDRQLNSIIAYLQESKQPQDVGGWGIGHIGPVPEGMVAWAIAAIVLVGMCMLLGARLRA